MECPKCKTENLPGTQFCSNCGAALNSEIPQTPVNLTDISQPTPNPRKKIIPIAAISLIALSVLGLLLYLYLNKSQKPSSSSFQQSAQTSSFESSRASSSLEDDLSVHPDIVRYSVDTDGDGISNFLEESDEFNAFVLDGMSSLSFTLPGVNITRLDPLVSVESQCSLASCDDPNLGKYEKKNTNILIIMDSSGSMAQIIGTTTKMEAAKDAFGQFVNGLDAENLNMGLMVYGHKGSNSVSDKQYSCSNIEIFYPVRAVDKNTIKSTVNSLSATGWTPIEGALNLAPQAFVGKENQDNHIVLISDGIEQCDGNPVAAAKRLRELNYNFTVDIIGFDIGQQDQQQLIDIASAGGGTFINAKSGEELYKSLKSSNENFRLLTEYGNCLFERGSVYGNCLSTVYSFAGNYLSEYSNKLSQSGKEEALWKKEYDIVQKLAQKLWNMSSEKAEKEWDNASRQGEENWQKADEQLSE